MSEQTPITGQVQGETLIIQKQGQQTTVPVESPSWFTWLESAASFTFQHEEGHFTAHKTSAGNRRGGVYWRATRRQHGKLSSFYLGKSTRLTLQRLREAARHLQGDGVAIYQDAELIAAPQNHLPVPADPMLITKLALPRLPVQHISRPRLLTLIEHSTQRPVTLISAPAGSGKTTLLAEWARQTPLPVSWISWEDADNDPGRFLSYLTKALLRLHPHSSTLERSLAAESVSSWQRKMIALLNELTHYLQKDAIIILDDLHLLNSQDIQPMLQFLLDHLPERLHLIMGTRVDPSLPLARLRALNQLSEIRAGDLHFASDELAAFAQAMKLHVTTDTLKLLETRSEGWIAGIQLLVLALRGQTDATAFLQDAGRQHHFLLDYVHEDILSQQSSDMQAFLLHTCVLDRFTGSLCDAVTRQTNGQERLKALRRANLFISELDDTRHWYRYHPLFAEAVRAQLEVREPGYELELYRRASHWYEEQGWREEACEYAFRARDLSRAAALLEQILPHVFGQGKLVSLDRWFSQLPPEIITEFPLLSIASLIRSRMREHETFGTSNAEASLRVLTDHLQQQIQAHAQESNSPWQHLHNGFPLLQAIAAWAQGDLARTVSLAQEILPPATQPDDSVSQIIAVGSQVLLGAAYGASGNLEEAQQIFQKTSLTGPGSIPSPFDFMSIFMLIELYEAQGQLRKLGQFYNQLFLSLEQNDREFPILALAKIRYAGLLYEWNRLPDAEVALQRGVTIGQRLEASIPGVALLSRSIEARIALVKGEKERAFHLLDKEFALWRAFPEKQAIRAIGAFPARLALACGQFALAEQWKQASNLHPEDFTNIQLSSRDYLPYATLTRTLLAQGTPQHLAQALTLLDHLRDTTKNTGAEGCFLEVQVLTALGLQAQRKTRRALEVLGSVLEHAEHEGYVRLFADEGQPMFHLLAQVGEYTLASPGYLELLQTVIGSPHASFAPRDQSQPQPLPEALTERELEVLSLLAEGLSNQQIAQRLVISLHTVKLHVKHILAKLTVINRTQAVARARTLQLL